MLDNKKRILCRCENENNRTFMMRLPFDYSLKVHNVSIANFWTSKEKKSETNQQKKSPKLVCSVELHNYIQS